MADLYSKVTRRPRSKLERVLEVLQPKVPKRPESSLGVQLVLFYLMAADVTPAEASAIVKTLVSSKGVVDGEKLLELDERAIPETCPAKNVPELLGWLKALGTAVIEGVEAAAERNVDEARKRLGTLPRMTAEHVDLVLLTCGALSTVAPSPTARRVACRLGYPGSSYAALARALDAEIPEGDRTEIAWRAHHALAQHGRDVCHQVKPACARCVVKSSCAYQGEGSDPASRLSSPGI